MKKSILSIAVVVSIITVMLVGACAAPAAGPTAAAPTAAAPAAQKTYEFKYANPYIEADDMFLGVRYMITQLEKRTNGRVKITAYHNQTLGKVTDHLTMLDTGIADLAQVMPDMFNKVFAVPAMLLNGALDFPNSKAIVMEAAYTLYNTGLMNKDFEKYKLLFFEGTDSAGIAFKSKIEALTELQKLKVRTPPGSFTDEIKLLGASAVSIPAGDIYMAVDRGTVDAVVTMPGSFFAQKINELTKYWVKFPMGIGVNLFIMNKDKWNSLPDDIKIIWEQINNETKYAYLDEMDRLYPDLDARFAKNGVTTYSLSDAEYAKWMQLMQPLQQKYISDWEAQGFPMKAADAKVRQVLARFK